MTNPSTQGPSPTGLTPVAAWARFVSRALLKRLDPDRFAALVPIHFSEHPPLGPVVIADILLRPTPEACETLDSRAIHYAMALLDLRLIDIPAILRALYKYSSAHTRARPHESDQLEGNGEKEAAAGVDGKKKNKGKDEQGKQQPQKKILRWRNSYPAEVAVLVRLAPVLAKGTVPLNPRHVVQMLKVLVSWMALLVEAAAAISREAFGALGMVKDETERARGALARFMVVVAENQTVLATLAKPECKGMYALGAVRC
jgi:mediator of RNA polymerase II transcription subunit 5